MLNSFSSIKKIRLLNKESNLKFHLISRNSLTNKEYILYFCLAFRILKIKSNKHKESWQKEQS